MSLEFSRRGFDCFEERQNRKPSFIDQVLSKLQDLLLLFSTTVKSICVPVSTCRTKVVKKLTKKIKCGENDAKFTRMRATSMKRENRFLQQELRTKHRQIELLQRQLERKNEKATEELDLFLQCLDRMESYVHHVEVLVEQRTKGTGGEIDKTQGNKSPKTLDVIQKRIVKRLKLEKRKLLELSTECYSPKAVSSFNYAKRLRIAIEGEKGMTRVNSLLSQLLNEHSVEGDDFVSVPKFDLKKILSRIDFTEDFVGRGKFGRVFRIPDFLGNSSEVLCVKVMDMEHEEEFNTEVSILKVLSECENVVKILAWSGGPSEGQQNGNESSASSPPLPSRFVGFVMEYCPVNLTNIVRRNLKWVSKLKILLNVSRAVEYIHSKDIIIVDLKWENVLAKDKVIKIIDFGSSKRMEGNELRFCDKMKQRGSFCSFSSDQFLTKQVDVYSFGVMMYEILEQRLLSESIENSQTFKNYRSLIQLKISGTSPMKRSAEMLAREMEELGRKSKNGRAAATRKRKIDPRKLWFVELLLACVNENSVERPSFAEISRALETNLRKLNKRQKKTM